MTFTYMGTKKPIAGHVAGVVRSARPGPFLDLFAGISSVGDAIASERQVWCNDIQDFAVTVAAAKFTSRAGPEIDAAVLSGILEQANANRLKLMPMVGDFLVEEAECLHLGQIRKIKDLCSRQIAAATSGKYQRVRAAARCLPGRGSYFLFSISYAGGYFGSKQALDIDCLRFAIDRLLSSKAINRDQHRWYILALCKAMFAVANTTGHFAQYLEVKGSTLTRFLAKRKRDVLKEWIDAIRELEPAGTAEWRRENRVFKSEAGQLLQKLKRSNAKPSVIYADPPYTADQYSRYYHLLETLIVYDYPELHGKGQYRSGRFVSDFSLQSRVMIAFEDLISRAANLGSDLVLNYPETGMLTDTKQSLLGLLRKYFRQAEVAASIPHQHSTLGASKGIERSAVTELVFLAR